MKTTIALTGATGAMGEEVLFQLASSPLDLQLKVLVRQNKKKRSSYFLNTIKKYKSRIEILNGDIRDYQTCENLVKSADYLIHCAAIIPPTSDHNPALTIDSNYGGTKNLVDAVINLQQKDKTKFIYIGTVAEYGSRNYKNLWGRVGDPLISSDFDYYSLSKICSERYVIEAGLKNFVSLRQTAVGHKYIFQNNLQDGLMFHTVWNSPLEWVSDIDSGILCEHLIKYDLDKKLQGFWNKIYNIGGGYNCRVTGFESLDLGFKIMGKGVKNFFKPNWNATRNFHGLWFSDSDKLEEWLHFRNESLVTFWKRIGKKHPFFKLGFIVPSPLISRLIIQRLFKSDNAPMYWLKHNNTSRLNSFFGGKENYDKIPNSWKDYPLLCEGQTPDKSPIDYSKIRCTVNATYLDHGFDESKDSRELDIQDMRQAAKFRGGKCLSSTMVKGDLFTKLKWECHEGHRFESSPFAILFGGFWCPECLETVPWSTGKVAKYSAFHAQVFLAEHTEEEFDIQYSADESQEDIAASK